MLDGFNNRRKKQRKRTILLGTWNVQGIRNKTEEIMKAITELKEDIIILTETKKKGSGLEIQGPYIHLYTGVPKEKHAQRGVSIMVKKKFRRCITNWEAIDENIIKMNINLFNKRLTILGVYVISDDAKEQKKEEFYTKLNGIIAEIGNSREIIMAGDFNGRTGRQIKNQVVGPYGEERVTDNGERLISFCVQNSLKILNGFFQHKEIHKYTRTQDTRRSIIIFLVFPISGIMPFNLV